MFTNRRSLLYSALLISTIISIWIQWPRISNPEIVQDDFRKFHGLLQFEDPELFPNDPLPSLTPEEVNLGPIQFSVFVDKTRPGYTLLYNLASSVIPPVLFNKLLIFPLMLLSVYFLFRIGEIAKDPITGFTLAVSFVVLTPFWPSSTSVASGLPRSFMAQFILGIIYFLMISRYWMAIIVALLAATVFLPAAVLGMATIGLAIIEPTAGRWRFRIAWRRRIPLLVLITLLILMLPSISGRIQGILISMVEQGWSFGAIFDDAFFGSGGRLPLFDNPPFLGHGGLVNFTVNLRLLTLLAPLSLAIYLIRPASSKEFPRILKLLLGASIILFLMAWLAIILTSSIALYFPSRYTRFSLVLVLLLFVIMNLGLAVQSFWLRMRRLTPRSRAVTVVATLVATSLTILLFEVFDLWFKIGTIATVPGLLLVLAVAFLMGTIALILLTGRTKQESASETEQNNEPRGLSILFAVLPLSLMLVELPTNTHQFFAMTPSESELVNFLQTTSKDSLIAGDPCSLDYVPMMAGRFYSAANSCRVVGQSSSWTC